MVLFYMVNKVWLILLQESNDYTLKDTSKYVKIGNVTYFLSLNLGFTSKSNAWAGPSYWKFHRTKGKWKK